MIAGQVSSGDIFFLPAGTTGGRWFRRVDHQLGQDGLLYPRVLPDAVFGWPTESHQNSIVVQEQMSGGFFFLDCNVTVEQPPEDEESE